MQSSAALHANFVSVRIK